MSSPRRISELRRRLGAVGRRIRLAAGLRGAAFALSASLALVLFSLAVDRFFRLGVPARSLLLVLHLVVVAAVVQVFVVRPLLAVLSSRILADLLERQRPDFRDLLRSAVSFAAESEAGSSESPGVEAALKRRVIEDGELLADEIAAISVVDRRRLGRAGAMGIGAAFLVALIFALAPDGTFGIWFRRNVLLSASVQWPYRTVLHVLGFEGQRRGVPRGDSLDIDVEVEGEMPTRAWIHLQYASEARRFPLAFAGDRSFRHSHPELREAFEFQVEGGDFRSPSFRVDLLERPRLESLSIVQVYPDYMGLAPATVPGRVGELSVPVGSELRISGRSTKELRSVAMRYLEESASWSLDPGDPTRFSGTLKPAESGALELRLVDTEGVRPQSPTRIGIHLLADRKPTVKLRAAGIGALVSERARIPLIVDASDDHRVLRVSIAHEARGVAAESSIEAPGEVPAARGSVPVSGVEPDTPIHAEPVFEVSEQAIPAESTLTLQALAEDGDTLNGPHVGVSGVLEFLVVSEQKLMDDFLRRQAEQHESFRRLILTERKIRDALYEDMDGGLRAEALDAELVDRLLSHARQQRAIATQSLAIGSALEQILAEMTNNRVGEADDLQRLGQKVIEPLRSLASTDLPALSSAFDDVRRQKKAVDRVTKSLDLAESMEETLERMDAILASMAKLEGYTEIVNQLRAIIGLQGESREAVRAAYAKLLRSVFDEDFFEEKKDAPEGQREGEGAGGGKRDGREDADR